MQEFAKKLKNENLKVTPQRLAIYDMLYHTDEHPSAETIHRKLKATHPSMSLATVYKTLETFKQHGLVQELSLGEDSFRYDAREAAHAHIICKTCKDVQDVILEKEISAIETAIVNQSDFFESPKSITHSQIYFYGTCKKCQAQSQNIRTAVSV